jgi:hypothetical protein
LSARWLRRKGGKNLLAYKIGIRVLSFQMKSPVRNAKTSGAFLRFNAAGHFKSNISTQLPVRQGR